VTGLAALPETVRGLPLHALVLHATVVLVPLAAVGTLVCAVWPAARRRYGPLVVLGALIATALVPITTSSGEDLRRRLGAEELVADHARWADRLLPAMLVLLVAVVALVVLDTTRRRTVAAAATAPATTSPPTPGDDPAPGTGRLGVLDRRLARSTTPAPAHSPAADRLRVVLAVVAMVAVVAAVVTLYVVFQTGESGARAVWGQTVANTRAP
jgi:hypothetical protein